VSAGYTNTIWEFNLALRVVEQLPHVLLAERQYCQQNEIALVFTLSESAAMRWPLVSKCSWLLNVWLYTLIVTKVTTQRHNPP
jgi:hypothetical protein